MIGHFIPPGMMMPLDGEPTMEGLYCCEVYWGWKLLEWKNGEWWHQGTIGRWTATPPLQWVGPLPPLCGTVSEPPAPQYDL